MKTKKLWPILTALILIGCLLAGCETTGETHLPDVTVTAAPVAASPPHEIQAPFSFADISDLDFWFGSGAGAWCTMLSVNEDGTFTGAYQDSDISVISLCNFTGKFTEPVKVNDYTYSVQLEQIALEREPGTEERKDGILYQYRDPYGLDDAEELLFYLPGAPVQALPEEYQSWMGGYGDHIDTELPFYGLFNVNAGQGFSSHKKITIYDELASLEQEAAALEDRLQTETLPQAEMTEIASELYRMWDFKLNDIWGRLKKELDAAAMDALTAEELEWIAYKEAEVQKAGADVAGGTLQPMVEYAMGAELTKARVYELAEYLTK